MKGTILPSFALRGQIICPALSRRFEKVRRSVLAMRLSRWAIPCQEYWLRMRTFRSVM